MFQAKDQRAGIVLIQDIDHLSDAGQQTLCLEMDNMVDEGRSVNCIGVTEARAFSVPDKLKQHFTLKTLAVSICQNNCNIQ